MELYSSCLYPAFAGYSDRVGFANRYMERSLGEIDHAMIFRRHLADQDERLRRFT